MMGPSDAERVYEWIKSKKGFLVYVGNVGCGKTFFCHALLNYTYKRKIISRNHSRLYNERDLLSRVRQETEYGEYREGLKYLTDDPLLIIDDIGSAPPGDWAKGVLFDLIDMRYETTLPTVVTSNLNEQQMKEWYGDRMASRLFAQENTIIEVSGTDYRKEGLPSNKN